MKRLLTLGVLTATLAADQPGKDALVDEQPALHVELRPGQRRYRPVIPQNGH
jgi:hypothetical protein